MFNKKLIPLLLLVTLSLTSLIKLQNANASLIDTITRTNGPTSFNGGSGSSSAIITLGYTPTSGRTLIIVVNTYSAGAAYTPVTSIVETGVTWTEGGAHAVEGVYYQTAEIWYGVVGVGASATINVTATGVAAGGIIQGYIMEYDQVLMPDVSAKSDNYYGVNPLTGTTSTTTASPEIWIGCIGDRGGATTMSTPLNGFTLSYTSAIAFSYVALLEKNIPLGTVGVANSGVTTSNSNRNAGIIVAFKINPASPPSSYYYTLQAKWENDTATTILVTAVSTGSSDAFNVSTSTTFYFTSRPVAFTWTDDSTTRQIVPTADTGTYTITLTTGTSTTYVYTIRDLVGASVAGLYLESYKYVGGVSTLIERAYLPPLTYTAPLNMQYNNAYTIQVVTSSGTIYSFGTQVAGISSTTLNLIGMSFSDITQQTYQYVEIEVQRTNTTNINVLYNDTRADTTTILAEWQYTNGTVAHSAWANGTSTAVLSYTTASAVDYYVIVTATGGYFGTYQTVYPAVYQASYSAPFNLGILGPSIFGIPAASFLAFATGTGFFLLFSNKNAGAGAVIAVVAVGIEYLLGWSIVPVAGAIIFALVVAIIFAFVNQRRYV